MPAEAESQQICMISALMFLTLGMVGLKIGEMESTITLVFKILRF